MRGVKRSLASSVWSFPFPLRIKCYSRPCWKKRLNTRELIGRRLWRNLGGCVICNQAPEIVHHLLSSCHLFSSIWKTACLALGVLHPQVCLEWLDRNCPKKVRRLILMLFAALAWVCWKERNARLFLNQRWSIASVALERIAPLCCCWFSAHVASCCFVFLFFCALLSYE